METAVVKGLRLRVTKTDACGLPLAGNANRIITEGFVTATLTPELKARQDLEQQNAQGLVCVSDSVPAERKWWNVALELCNVNPDLFSLIATWARVLDYDGNPIGFRDKAQVDSDTGVAFEIWTGGSGDDDCPVPTDDSVFSAASSGKSYGYLLFTGKEFVSDALSVKVDPSTFTLNGQTFAPKRWGRGPYNVAATDSSGTPGRLLVPAYDKDDDNHIVFFRTPVKPPEVSDGACELAITSIFDEDSPYFGTSAGDPAVDVAPAQPMCNGKKYMVSLGGATAGNFTLSVGSDETATITFSATASVVQTAIEALGSVAPGQVQVTGSAGSYTVTLDSALGTLTGDGTGLTGGSLTVTAA